MDITAEFAEQDTKVHKLLSLKCHVTCLYSKNVAEEQLRYASVLKHSRIPGTPALSEKCYFCAQILLCSLLLSRDDAEETLRCTCVQAATAIATVKIKCYN